MTLFAEYSKYWLEHYKLGTVKPNTYRQTYKDTFRLHLIPVFGMLPLDALTKQELQAYLNELGKRYSKSTLCKVRLCVLGMYAAAIDEGLCTVNPAQGVKLKSLVEKQNKRTYTAAEVDKLFEYAATHRYGLGVCIMLDTGCRCSEMLGLKWEDVDFHGRCIHIKRASVTVDYKAYVSIPKSASSVRTLPLTSRLLSLLQNRKAFAATEYIVPAPNGNPYTPANYTKNRYNLLFKDCEADIGLFRLSPHELRHTCGTVLYERSGDIYAVSKFLGHSNVAITTNFYVHSNAEILRKRLGI